MQKTILSAGRKSLAALTVGTLMVGMLGVSSVFASGAANTVNPTTNAATAVTMTGATLNGVNANTAATDSSFWVATSTFSVASSATLPTGVYSTPTLGALAPNATFSSLLSSVAGVIPITPNTTYYYAAWADIGGTWTPGAIMSFTTAAASATLPGTLAAQDFGVMDVSGVNGYTAGFGLTDATFAGVQSAVVQLYSGTTLLQTDTLDVGTANVTALTGNQISSPFDVSGTFNYAADGYWTNVRGTEYGQTMIPTSVVATVTLANGKVVTATNTNLTGAVSTVTTAAATGVVSTGATLNGVNANTAATDSSFWVATSTFTPVAGANPTMPAGVYSTPTLGALAPNEAFSSPLSSVAGVIPITPNTTYYYAAWSDIGGTWTPGAIMSFTTAAGVTAPVAPIVSSVSPSTGTTAGGTVVTITGTGLTGATAVDFGSSAATGVVVNSDTSITATSPAALAGTVDVTITTSQGTSVVSEGDKFVYSASSGSIGGTVTGSAGVLTVTSITPVQTSATSDNTYADGWSYIFNITVPTNEPNLSMSFADWIAADSNTIPVAGNMQISSAQALASTTPVTITAANVYSSPALHIVGNLSTTTPGLHVQVLVQVKIPLNIANDSYTTNYGVQTQP